MDGCLYAVNYDGSLRWRLRTGGITESSPIIANDGRIYVGVNRGLWAVSASGTKLWSRPGEGYVESTPVALADGSVLFNDRRGVLLNLRADTWIMGIANLGSYDHGGLNIAPNGIIYGAGGDAMSFAAIRSSLRLADTPWPKFRGNTSNTGRLEKPGRNRP